MVVYDGWDGRVDSHADGEVGVIAGPSMTSGGLCCDIVEGGQGGAPTGGGDAVGDRKAGVVVPARLASNAGVGVNSRVSGEALFLEVPRPVRATDGGAWIDVSDT